MQSIDTEMEQSMSKNLKDIIAGAFKYKKTRPDRADYIKARMHELYSKIRWSVIIYDFGSSRPSYTKPYFFYCEMNNQCIIVFGYIH
jgi:hypothetical protein